MPPTRIARYCCQYLKEDSGDGRKTVTGVRWSESVNRKKNQGMVTVMTDKAGKEFGNHPDFRQTNRGGVVLVNDNSESRRMIEQCYKRHRVTVNPIIDWSDRDVWDFIHGNKLRYCGLYNDGFSRLGCIGCPMAYQRTREIEFLRWPKYKDAYLRAFEKMLDVRRAKGKGFLSNKYGNECSAKDVFNWWMEYDILPGQINLFEDYEEEE